MAGQQLSLFGADEPHIRDGFARLRRTQLDACSWLDYVEGFVGGHDVLFARLQTSAPFRTERRVMYEREVAVPRLVASLPLTPAVEPVLLHVGRLLAERYGASFEHVGLALYRDGDDSVAFHRDKMPRDRPTLVAILSLGEPRRMLVRPFGGGASRAFSLGWGDLFVMGGACQQHWEHGIPKLRSAGPRMSIMFRHVYES